MPSVTIKIAPTKPDALGRLPTIVLGGRNFEAPDKS
jgi:hypothetical protein